MLAKMTLDLETGYTPTDEQWEVIHQLFPATVDSKHFFSGDHTIVMDSEQLMLLTADKGFKIGIQSVSAHNMIVKMRDKYDNAISSVENYHRGNIIQVHVPNMALLTYNEVTVYEDSCTDELQKALNQGWRIIAVCPPNSQRRPDYILGRYNPDGSNR
jgi:hypothetical protein